MNLIDTINKAQDMAALEKGAFNGNQHIDASGSGIEYHSGVKGTEPFKSQAKPAEGYMLRAVNEAGTNLWRANIINIQTKEVFKAPLAQSAAGDAMQHGRDLLAGRIAGFH